LSLESSTDASRTLTDKGGKGGVEVAVEVVKPAENDRRSSPLPPSSTDALRTLTQAELLHVPSATPRTPRKRRPREDHEPNPRHAPLRERLLALFREVKGVDYRWSAKDAGALAELLEVATDGEIERRWVTALRCTFPTCRGFHDVNTNWNAYTDTGAYDEWLATRGAAPANQGPPPGVASLDVSTPGGRCWSQALEWMRANGKRYALTWLERITAAEVEGDVLKLVGPDHHFVAWAMEHCQGLIADALASVEGAPKDFLLTWPGQP
jgi:hypothetical protein